MEMHARFFIDHFAAQPSFPLGGVITRDTDGRDARVVDRTLAPIDLNELPTWITPAIVFFNSGRWIEDLRALRRSFPHAVFMYRTGGNEILKAPLERMTLPSHEARQAFWAGVLNDTLDVLVTNSAFTEDRLRGVGVSTPFLRSVGGVDDAASVGDAPTDSRTAPVLFCAARFVPYKNHRLLLDVVAELARRGVSFTLRLAGVGPLLDDARRQAHRLGLSERVTFLGEIDNAAVCRETAEADAYVQLSGDVITPVPGGAYVHSEGMGRSILEAIAAGTYVIAGRSGALPEIVTPDRGLLLELSDPTNIADVIEPVLRRPVQRRPHTDEYRWSTVFASYERCWEGMRARSGRH